MRALVTGASGFVGQHLVALLRSHGDHVVSLDRTPGPSRPVDIADTDAVLRAVADATPDVVYHLAGLPHVGTSWDARAELERVNVGGTRAVLEACRVVGVGRVLVVGSAEQYGPVPADAIPVTEDTPLHPLSPYGESKCEAESAALEAWRDHAVPSVCVRAFNHTGPGQSLDFFVPGFAHRIAEAEAEAEAVDEIPVGNLESVRDFTDVRDVVRAYRLLVERGAPGEAYNVCSGEGVRIRALAERLLARARRPLRLSVDPELVRPVEVPVFVGDPAKLVAATGWTRTVALDTTLDDVLAEARERATT